VSPRFGMSWDLMGDGRTAVKAGISRYDRLAGANLVQPLNQKNISFQTCPWSDPNGNLFAEVSEIGTVCSGSLQPSLGFVEEGLKRPYQWEWNVSVQRQVGARTSVMLAYYGRKFWDLYATVNDAVPSTAYSPVTITNPLDGSPLTVYNQDPNTRGQVRNVLKTLPELSQRYHGVEAQFATRIARANVFGGITLGQNYGDQEANDLNNPNFRIFNRGNIGFDAPVQVRAGFSYSFPYAVQFAGSLRSSSGLPQTRTFPVTTTQVPGLTQVTQNVQVAERGDFRYDWINLLDLRISKSFTLGGVRIEPMADLFNVFNNNAVTNANQIVGAQLGRPSAIVMGRLLRLGGRLAF
jgi:hypothetical protein